MRGLAALLVLVAACTTIPVVKECKHPCFKSVTASFEMECARFDKNVENLKGLYDKAGIIPVGDFCETFTGTEVFFRPEGTFFYVYDEKKKLRVTGVTWLDNTVELTRDGFSLAHELLHVLDASKGVDAKENHDHVDWGKKGYFGVTYDFTDSAYSMAPEHYLSEPLDKPIKSN